MTSIPSGPLDTPYDPGSMPSSSLSTTKAVWYRRPWFFVTTGIILVVAVSVITDLPHPITKAQDAAQQDAVIKLINGDASPCIYALKESFNFYADEVTHNLASSNLKTVKNYLLQDQTVCSFASGPITDMTNNIQISPTKAGKQVYSAYQSVVKWLTYDGVHTVLDIEAAFATSPFHANTVALSKDQNALRQENFAASAYIQSASNTLGISLTPIKLPTLPRLPGT